MSKINVPSFAQAYQDLRDARGRLDIALKRDYPVGATVRFLRYSTWRQAAGELSGELLAHSGGLRVKVRATSGKEYWIEASRLLPPLPEPARPRRRRAVAQ